MGSTALEDSAGREFTAIIRQPKRFALLAYLAIRPRVFHRRDTLLALFWPELDAIRAGDALSQAVLFLRTKLGTPTSSVLVNRGRNELGIDGTCLWCDAAGLRDHVEAGRHSEALDLYRGELLDGFHVGRGTGVDDWIECERARLRCIGAAAARALTESLTRDGDLIRAADAARRAVELSDVDERALRGLLELLHRIGDRAGALRTYDAFAHRVALELGTTPSVETLATIERILSGRGGGMPMSA